MRFKNKDIENALQTLIDEIEYQEQALGEAENAEEHLRERVETLELELEESKAKIKELEEALAEAYLTSERDHE